MLTADHFEVYQGRWYSRDRIVFGDMCSMGSWRNSPFQCLWLMRGIGVLQWSTTAVTHQTVHPRHMYPNYGVDPNIMSLAAFWMLKALKYRLLSSPTHQVSALPPSIELSEAQPSMLQAFAPVNTTSKYDVGKGNVLDLIPSKL